MIVRSDRRVDDATWHTLQCRRQDGTISVIVDGTVDASKTAATGGLSHNARSGLAPRTSARPEDNDQFHGRIDGVFLKIDRR